MNEIVKYHNNMNLVNFNHFTEVEFNIFFAVCQQMRDKNLSIIELSFEKIRELTNYKNRSIPRLIKDIENTYTKLIQSNMRIETKDKIIRFVLFTEFEIDKNKQIVTIQTNQKFEYILNAVTSNFTRFELEQFVSLSKTNSKTIYRMLKQYRMTGFWAVDYQEFLEMLNMQKWTSGNITNEFKRIVKDLEPFFKNLVVEKVKKGGKQTGAILTLKWKFDPDERYIGIRNKIIGIDGFYIFLKTHFEAGKIITADEFGSKYYFAPDGEFKSVGSDKKVIEYLGDINDKSSDLYKIIRKIKKLKIEEPNMV